MRLNQVTLPSGDLDVSVSFYQRLGLTLIVDARPRYVRFELGSGDTMSLHYSDSANRANQALIYFECDDLDNRVAMLRGAGVVFDSGPRDESWLWREARLKDPDSNPICLYFAGSARRFPPWRVDKSESNP